MTNQMRRPVLIAGPTASGKSALALHIAARDDGAIINADALQVYDNWRILTARPPQSDTQLVPHLLYGHVAKTEAYSTGHWLRDLKTALAYCVTNDLRPIIVGGTGLNFTAATQGLAEIPTTPADIRIQGDALTLSDMTAALAQHDPKTLANIDMQNRARVQRAWEVWTATGRGLKAWQTDTPAPLLPLNQCDTLVLTPDIDWLNDRIAHRFTLMLTDGARDEVIANLDDWVPNRPSSRAIGAPELMAAQRGEMTEADAINLSIIATRQYAKRQRTWFRNRMKSWNKFDIGPNSDIASLAAMIPTDRV